MAGSVERIEREIAAMEEAIAQIAVELQQTYSSYLNALGSVVKQQLVLASYHLCTQVYPNSFLSLPFSQRQRLQQAVREIGKEAGIKLLAAIQPSDDEEEEVLSDTDGYGENMESEEEKFANSPISQPAILGMWQQSVETAIAKTLQTASRDSNHLLQQVGILPKKLPEPVLEAAAKIEATAEGIAGPPNLLNLVIESEDDDELQSSIVTHIYAIHLRLVEIELTDSNAIAYRHQIRNLSARFSSLEREYQKKQRERSVAEAELAWRASWFDE